MRATGHILAMVCACGTILSAQPPSAVERAAKVLEDARAALGGGDKIAGVKTLTATGRTRKVQGENLVPIEFEIAAELPDKYIRKDEIPAQESDPTTNGFNGEALIQVPAPSPPPAREAMPAPPAGQFEAMLKQRAMTFKQDFARLMLGLFASSYQGYPLTFKYVGQAEAPQGKAHVLEGTGPGNFTLRFFVHAETNLPVMVSWQAARPAPPGRGGPQPSGHGLAPGAPNTPPENRLYFADYRDVDGLKLPFRLRRAVGTDTTEETTFDRFRINPKIDPRRFEVRK